MSQQPSPRTGGDPARHVRPRTGSDLDACVKSLAEVHDRDGYPVNWPDDPAGWLTRSSQFAAWVAELDGRVAGHLTLSHSEPDDLAPALWGREAGVPADATAVISRLFVSPEARGHGLGALLMAEAVREARERELHPVLDVVTTDTSAAALYERLGWRLLATVDQRWGPEQTVTLHCYSAPD